MHHRDLVGPEVQAWEGRVGVGETARELATHVSRLLVYLLAGGALLCAVLGLMTYAILARIDQGFAVFG
jgi:hypothetical protein